MRRTAALLALLIMTLAFGQTQPARAEEVNHITLKNQTDKWSWVTVYEYKNFKYNIQSYLLSCVGPGAHKELYMNLTDIKVVAEIKSSATDCHGSTLASPYDKFETGAGHRMYHLDGLIRPNGPGNYAFYFNKR
jgi:hypothetical protein